MGPAGGADWQVRVAPRRSRVLRRLPYSHAGADPREKSHGCRVPAPPLALPLVETSFHCTSLPSFPLSPETATDHFFQFGHIRWIFISLIFVFVVLDFLCCHYWADASVYVLLCICWFFSRCDDVGIPVDYITLWSCWLQLLCSVHPPIEANLLLYC